LVLAGAAGPSPVPHAGASPPATTGVSSSAPIVLKGVASYDPYGDNKVEDPGQVGLATDGDEATAWSTEQYYDRTLNKPGVGLVLDAGAPVKLSSLTVISTTPGYEAVIRSGASSTGPCSDDSASQTGGTTTTWTLGGSEARYYLIWITSLGNQESVKINEVTAR